MAVVAAALATRSAAADPIDTYIAQAMTRLHIPGMAVAVVRAGKIEKLGTYGVANLEWQPPVTADTRFQIASTTKVFTGTLVMLLVQDGTIALAEPVAKYLPDAPAAWRSVTIAHLAAHAAGIPDVVDPKLGSVADAYAAVRGKPLAFPPGSRAAYGGGDFIVLAQVLERATGKPFTELLRTRLIEPLKLTCTSFEDARDAATTRTAQVVPRRASVYRWETDHQRLHWFVYPPYTYAMGGAFSCISDLVKWAAAMDQVTLLTAPSERRVATPFTLGDRTSAGFGVVFTADTQRGRRRYGHSGGPALGDVLRFPDDKLTVIVLANQQRLNPNFAATIAGMQLPAARERPLRDARPALSKRLREIADAYRSGAFDPASFAAATRAELVAALREWGPVIAGTWPAIERWTLVDERTVGKQRARVYRAHHGSVPVRWTFTLDAAELVVDVDAQPD